MDVNDTFLLQIKDNLNNEYNYIVTLADIGICIKQIVAELTIHDLALDLPQNRKYSLAIAFTNDATCNKASSPGSLGYYFVRLRFQNCYLKSNNPLTFEGDPLSFDMRVNIPL